MTPSEHGQVMAFLLKHRRLETFSTRKKSKVDERALGLLLRDSAPEDRAELAGVLRGMGFDLVEFTSLSTQGIPPGGHVFVLVRRFDDSGDLLGERWIEDRMALRNNSVAERRIWFTQFWFVLFDLLYTRRDRTPTEVSRYVETTFTKPDLSQSMREYINELVRKLGHDALKDDTVYSCLISESGTLVEQYAERFLSLMTDGALLDRLGEDKYRQSLVSAAEMRSNYLQGLEPLMQSLMKAGNPLEESPGLLVRVVDDASQEEG